jgi:hypothetical protein
VLLEIKLVSLVQHEQTGSGYTFYQVCVGNRFGQAGKINHAAILLDQSMKARKIDRRGQK